MKKSNLKKSTTTLKNKSVKNKALISKSVKPLRIAVVTARFNEEVTSKLEDGAFDYLEEINAEILSVRVPGAIEIPLAIQALFESKKIDGIVALGSVIRGETGLKTAQPPTYHRGLYKQILVFTVDEDADPFGVGGAGTPESERAPDGAGTP